MPAFAILEPPRRQHAAIEHADRFMFLADRFSLGAFLLGPLWMIWRRLWVVLIVYLVGVGLVGYGLWRLGIDWTGSAVVFGLIHLLLGLEATSLVRWTRVRHGWRECGIVIADDLDLAERRFFDNQAALRAVAKPNPTPAPGQFPPAQFGPSHPDIIGLFPEPGGGR
jgi:hypothetical protein